MCVKAHVTEHGWNIRHRKGTVVRETETETETRSSVLQVPRDPGVATYSTIPTVSKMIAVQYMDPWRVSGRAHDAVSSQAATPGLAAYCLCGSTNAVCA